MIDKNLKVKIIESCSFSYPRLEGDNNHDAVLPAFEVNGDIYLALADGVGKSYAAKIAATTAIASVFNTINTVPASDMKEIYHNVQSSLEKIDGPGSFCKNIATTLVVCRINRKGITVANVGDSRAYIVNERTLKKITNDHTQKEELLKRGIFTERELKNHYSENFLTNSVQRFNEFNIDIHHEEIKSGMIILVSDGVYKTFKGRRVIGNVTPVDLLQVSVNIKRQILKMGAKDDFSLVAVSYR